MKQLGIDAEGLRERGPVHFGGPVEGERGFVLHSRRLSSRTARWSSAAARGLTATLDILRAIGRGAGPRRSLLALGYAGWGPGQLDAEIQANGWLNVAADDDIVFGPGPADKWQRALAKLGVHPIALSGDAGHA